MTFWDSQDTRENKEFVQTEVEDFGREVERVRNQSELMGFLDQGSKSERRYTLNEARKSLEL